MASSINSGGFSNQPIKGKKQAEKSAGPGQDQGGFQIQDGLTLSNTPAPEAPLKNTPAPDHEGAKKETLHLPQTPPEGGWNATLDYDPATGVMTYNFPNARPGDLDKGWSEIAFYEGAHLTGPGVTASLAAIGPSSSAAGVTDSTFTNGLGSTQLIGLSGKVLADLSPFKS